MRLVGLTGGIASGKSTVSNLFRSEGLSVVDADVVARDVVRKGTCGWKNVVKAFGHDILLDNGEIDRARLGRIVFADPEKRQLLNRKSGHLPYQSGPYGSRLETDIEVLFFAGVQSISLLAPYIFSGIFWEVVKLWIKGSKVIILDIPLLLEVKMDRRTSPIIVVWVDPETQMNRLMARDGISEEAARNKINAKMPLDLKRTKANIVIKNSGTTEVTKSQFHKILSQVNRPLTWKEYTVSRDGMLWILASAVIGVWPYIKIYCDRS